MYSLCYCEEKLMTGGFLSLRLTISITCAMLPYLLEKLFLKVVKTFPKISTCKKSNDEE